MKQYKVEYTPAAKEDLKSIYSYIAFHLKELPQEISSTGSENRSEIWTHPLSDTLP